jgi:cell division initiation protein
MLQAQLEQVKSPEWDEILAPFSSYVQEDHEVIREVLSKELDIENTSEVNSEEAENNSDDDISIVEASGKVVKVSEKNK